MSSISFDYPIFFLIIPLFYICQKKCKIKLDSLIFPNLPLLKKVAKKQNLLLSFFKFITIIFIAISLASPIKKDGSYIDENKGYEISLILDVSGSMRIENKFNIVKNIVIDFLDKREEDKLSLTLFANFAYIAMPLTYDKRSIKELLKMVDVGIAGVNTTALYEALFISSQLFKKSKSKNKIAILLTDGYDNAKTIPLKIAMKEIKLAKIKVYTIGVGRGGYNSIVLKNIAKESNAKFFEVQKAVELKKIYAEIDRLEKSDIEINKFVKKSYYFQYPLALGLLSFLIFIFVRRGRVV